MRSSGKHPMEGELHVDEFVVESQEVSHMGRSYRGKKKKTVCTVELTEEAQGYFMLDGITFYHINIPLVLLVISKKL